MAMKNPYAEMKQKAVFTAPKEELTLMLYDGALKFCNQAMIAIEEKNYEKAHNLLIKVQDIMREFQLTLNRDYEVSQYFDAMYDYIFRRAVEANLKKDLAVLSEIRDLIRDMRDTWKEAINTARSSKG